MHSHFCVGKALASVAAAKRPWKIVENFIMMIQKNGFECCLYTFMTFFSKNVNSLQMWWQSEIDRLVKWLEHLDIGQAAMSLYRYLGRRWELAPVRNRLRWWLNYSQLIFIFFYFPFIFSGYYACVTSDHPCIWPRGYMLEISEALKWQNSPILQIFALSQVHNIQMLKQAMTMSYSGASNTSWTSTIQKGLG